jgi:plastocyanin
MPGTLTPTPTPSNDTTPPNAAPPTDQELFDASVIRNGRILFQVLAGLGIFAALIMSTIALLTASGRHTTTTTVIRAAAAPVGVVSPAAGQTIRLSAAGASKRGPDGKMHDAFSKTNFTVKVGQSIHLRIDNEDDAAHSITAPAIGVNIIARPGIHTYNLLVTKAGRFEWMCVLPCDSWAMMHPGYMAGYITAT